MRVQSIGATIEPRDPAGDRFLGAAVKMALRKMHGIAELDHLAQKIRAMAEALENAGHLLAARVGAPFVVDRATSPVASASSTRLIFILGSVMTRVQHTA